MSAVNDGTNCQTIELEQNSQVSRRTPGLMAALEATSAVLMVVIVVLLLAGVVTRYVLASPLVWIDEAVSICFIWLAMTGAVIAMHRNEHLRLTLFLALLPTRWQLWVHAAALMLITVFLVAMLYPAYEYAREEWLIRTPALDMPNSIRVTAILFGLVGMLLVIGSYIWRTASLKDIMSSGLVVFVVITIFWVLSPQLSSLPAALNITVFLAVLVAICLAAGVPIGFCFGLGTLAYLAFTTSLPLMVIISRMDEGMSSIVLVSVPIFVLLGCVLDATGMGKAIIDFLSSIVGHIKAGMSYVLLGSLFIVSGISGSKASDMATVAPALFPEMERRGYKRPAMIALLATGAAMADTVPPSIVLIVLGSVAGVSIAGLFQSGFVVAMVLLLTLALLARWKARHEKNAVPSRPTWKRAGKLMLIAAPALALPFLIRGLVGGGVATATEVSTIAVVYALLIGHYLYGGVTKKRLYEMLVETASLSGAILLVLGTASAMAWAIVQSGFVLQLSNFLTTLPGGSVAFLAVTVVAFLILGCLLEGLPAVLLLAPIMFPIASKLGIHDIHYAMVVITAMNVGLMAPPIGIGFYIACRIGGASPDIVAREMWAYLTALLIGVFVIAAVPWFSTVALQ